MGHAVHEILLPLPLASSEGSGESVHIVGMRVQTKSWLDISAWVFIRGICVVCDKNQNHMLQLCVRFFTDSCVTIPY